MIETIYSNQNELYHYGVKGMKWGVRRYQNEDGTYTDRGQKRVDKLARTRDRYLAKSDKGKKRFNELVRSTSLDVADLQKNKGRSKVYKDWISEKKSYAENSYSRDMKDARSNYYKNDKGLVDSTFDYISESYKAGQKYTERMNAIKDYSYKDLLTSKSNDLARYKRNSQAYTNSSKRLRELNLDPTMKKKDIRKAYRGR